MKGSTYFCMLFLTTVSVIATPVGAQTPGEQGGYGLEEVVVTAQKRSESAQRIPITIDAVSSDDLEVAGIDNLVAAQKLTPGVVFSRAPDEGVQLTFRGLGTPARNTSFEQSVGAFADGVFFGNPAMYVAPFFDVERIEFIKGTQSALLGKNTSVGAISIVNRRPGDKTSLEGSISRELEYGGWTGDVGADLPVSDTLKLRAAGHYKKQTGWVRNIETGHSAISSDDLAGRLVATWTPGSLKATASYQYVDADRTGTSIQVVTPDGVFRDFRNGAVLGEGRLDGTTAGTTKYSSTGDGLNHVRMHVGTVTLDIPVGRNTLTSQTSYVNLDSRSVNPVVLPTVGDVITPVRNQDFNQFSEEIRLTSPGGDKLDYMLGAYYLHSSLNSIDTSNWDVPDFFVPGPVGMIQLLNGDFTNFYRQKLKSYSIFANGTLHVSDRLRVAGSVRYSDETKDVHFRRTAFGTLTFWNTISFPSFADTPMRFSDSFVNGNLNIQFDLTPSVMAYVSYGRGTKSGGFADSATISGGNPATEALIKSETADTVEAGIKSTLLNQRLVVNVAAFHSKVENYQVTYFANPLVGFVNLNVPARSSGLEAKVQARVTRGIDVYASATYADAIDRSTGLQLVSAPRVTMDGGFTLQGALGSHYSGTASVSAHRRSSIYSQYGEGGYDGPFATVDAYLSFGPSDETWKVWARGSNLFNAKGADFGIDNVGDNRYTGASRYLNPLRMVEVGLSVKL